ncbi:MULTISPECIES: acylphosphatase [unclassified Methanoculleus]|uniref:acylphosphatase n=1 Tax=unclassified Methanoculleus TaxID=2619537 RepID=UPI0025DF7017|nr:MULTISPECIES: acylphosphatase [unclassified Methanoculleus]MCK9318229.1 acylphosphatase [Methanoculleus sp.]MDD2254738.1 acylphosphatase [Methanoculleus sp.]MDD2787954.1 acylphosphatase [Methanoculleus sp.]MDD4315359.1 acylphosphatase [Methanoculleus sp.]MDD4471878.1 acylphosphatase [Methanoculleus sp.]
MKRFVATARGRVQRVGYREYVYNETFERNISGYVKNLDTGEVEIVAEGNEKDLRDFINEINIIRRPIAVRSFTVRWEEATGKYADFEILRGDIQEETFERMDYAGNLLHSMDTKFDLMLDKRDQNLQLQHTMLDKQDQMLQIARETKEEIAGLRSDTRKHLDDEFAEIRKELVSIKDALARAGIQV